MLAIQKLKVNVAEDIWRNLIKWCVSCISYEKHLLVLLQCIILHLRCIKVDNFGT